MELWIRSQDKDSLIKVEKIELTYDYLCSDDILLTYIETDKGRIGSYSTEERALEVLDEIQKIIGWLQKDMKGVTIGDLERLIGSFDNYVYEMPKE